MAPRITTTYGGIKCKIFDSPSPRNFTLNLLPFEFANFFKILQNILKIGAFRICKLSQNLTEYFQDRAKLSNFKWKQVWVHEKARPGTL